VHRTKQSIDWRGAPDTHRGRPVAYCVPDEETDNW
jgi:hypothetical protein